MIAPVWTTLYCPACGHNVRVAHTPAPTHEGHANLPDGPELVCLDVHDAHCTGTCPITNMTHAVMDVRLDSSGIEGLVPPHFPRP